MADANHAYNAGVARQLLRGCEQVDLYWLEEPIPPEDLTADAELHIAVAGGFTALRDMVVIAQAAGMLVNPHVWGTAVGLAASIQMLATIAPNPVSRGQAEPMLEYDASDHPFRRPRARVHRSGRRRGAGS